MSSAANRHVQSSLNPKSFELTLLPTEQCNFRCTYCYEDFEIGKMRSDVISGVKNLLLNRVKNISSLHLQWFGGEPLAAKSIVYSISKFAQELCEAHEVDFSGAITTNGYLLDLETAKHLHMLGQRSYQISLDGMEKAHDSTRRLASGAGTFTRIMANLTLLRDSNLDVAVLLRVHLTPDNFDSVKELATYLRQHFLHDSRFDIFLKTIVNLGGPNSASLATLNKTDGIRNIEALRSIVYENSTDAKKNSTGVIPICYASKPNSLVVRADGRVQKCTVLLNDEDNTVGYLEESGSVVLDQELMAKWMRGYITGDSSELNCPAQNFPRSEHGLKTIPLVAAS